MTADTVDPSFYQGFHSVEGRRLTDSQVTMEIVPEKPATTSSPLFIQDPEASSSVYENMTWVQCDSPTCLKWRLGPKVDLEKAWFCSMNPDPVYSSCSVPQADIPSESMFRKHCLKIVYSVLPVGSLVLAKACKWPWWPAVLSLDPDLGDYVSLDSDGDVESYHVEFLGKPHSRYWVSDRCVKSYRPITSQEYRTVKGAILRRSFDLAIVEATSISEMGCEERLQTCLFRPHSLFSEAQRLMSDIEKMMNLSKAVGSSSNRQHRSRERQQVSQGSVKDDGDILIIEGFRFESAVCREELRRLGSQHGGGHSGAK